jgi:hypothetical protein
LNEGNFSASGCNMIDMSFPQLPCTLSIRRGNLQRTLRIKFIYLAMSPKVSFKLAFWAGFPIAARIVAYIASATLMQAWVALMQQAFLWPLSLGQQHVSGHRAGSLVDLLDHWWKKSIWRLQCPWEQTKFSHAIQRAERQYPDLQVAEVAMSGNEPLIIWPDGTSLGEIRAAMPSTSLECRQLGWTMEESSLSPNLAQTTMMWQHVLDVPIACKSAIDDQHNRVQMPLHHPYVPVFDRKWPY